MANIIVFPTDFSDIADRAIPWAKDMADKFAASIHCLYIVEEPQIYSTLDLGAVSVPSTADLVSSAESRLQAYISEHFGNTPAATIGEVVVGHAATDIVKYAKAKNAKLIVMSTHGYSGVKHMLMGSTTEEVLRHAGCPVLSVSK